MKDLGTAVAEVLPEPQVRLPALIRLSSSRDMSPRLAEIT